MNMHFSILIFFLIAAFYFLAGSIGVHLGFRDVFAFPILFSDPSMPLQVTASATAACRWLWFSFGWQLSSGLQLHYLAGAVIQVMGIFQLCLLGTSPLDSGGTYLSFLLFVINQTDYQWN